MEVKPVIQLALDFVNLDRALKAAGQAAGSVDWIEAGTPLIKSEGLQAVRALKKKFSKHVIVADLKTMDCGRLEVESAAKAGADVACVLGAACDSTIKEAVAAGKNFGVKIMVDLIGVKDPVKRAKEVAKLGPDFVGLHTPIDEQMQAKTPFKKLKGIVDSVDVPVAAAGGLNSESVVDALKAGASILVVGGAVTKAENPKKAASEVRKAVASKTRIKTKFFKRSADLKKIFSEVSAANVSDAMHRSGELSGVFPVLACSKFSGPAVTVRTMPGDWAKTVEAIDEAKLGDVIVIDASGVGPAVWGGLATESALKKKLSGVVIFGGVRDVAEILALGFPVYASVTTPTAGEPKGFGEINVPIKVAGVEVKPGDWVVGDDDGVVVVPKERAVEVANRAMDVLEKENRIRKEIKDGSSLGKVTHLLKWEKRGQ